MQPNQHQNRQQKKPLLNSYAKFSAIAFQMVILFAGLALGGNHLDNYWEFNFPFLTLSGVLLAMIAMVVILLKVINNNPE